jgi:hypothetical protein
MPERPSLAARALFAQLEARPGRLSAPDPIAFDRTELEKPIEARA